MHPVGPLPSRVYWIRRAIAIGAAVIVLVLLAWFVVSKATGGNPTNTGAQTPVVAESSSSGPLTGVLASDPSSAAAAGSAASGSPVAGSAAPSSPAATAAKSSTANGSAAAGAAASTSASKTAGSTTADSEKAASTAAAAGSSKPAAAPAPERTATPPPATVDTKAEQAAAKKAAAEKAAAEKAAAEEAAAEKAAAEKAAAEKKTAEKAAAEKAAAEKKAAEKNAAEKAAAEKQAAEKAAAEKKAAEAAAAKAAEKAAPTTDAQGRLICQPSAIKLTTTSGAPSYRVGDKPILGLVVTNTSDTPCAQDTSGAKQVFTASTAGGERVWSTNDCFPGTGTETRMLQPGESVPFNIKWAGTTSQPNCAGERVEVKPGKYVITAQLDGRKAEPVTVTFNG